VLSTINGTAGRCAIAAVRRGCSRSRLRLAMVSAKETPGVGSDGARQESSFVGVPPRSGPRMPILGSWI